MSCTVREKDLSRVSQTQFIGSAESKVVVVCLESCLPLVFLVQSNKTCIRSIRRGISIPRNKKSCSSRVSVMTCRFSPTSPSSPTQSVNEDIFLEGQEED